MLSEARWVAMLRRIWDSPRLRRFLRVYLAIGVLCAVGWIVLGVRVSGARGLRDPGVLFGAVACIVAWPAVLVLCGFLGWSFGCIAA